MAQPFRSAPARSGFGRALRSKRAIAFEAIENLLAVSDSVREVSREDVAAVCDAQDVDLEHRFASDRKYLYRRYLVYCLEDKALSEEESASLRHLQALLYLRGAEVAELSDEVSQEIYGMAIQEVLADLEIDAHEEAFLRRLRDELRIADDVADNLLERGQNRARALALSQAASPDEDFSTYRLASGEFTGRSDHSFEASVADALRKAQIAMPRLHWFEVVQIAGYVGDGKPKGWHISVRCGMQPGANS